MLILAGFLGIFVGVLFLAWIGARRFEIRRIAKGEWDSHGPKKPTLMPWNFRVRRRPPGTLAFDLDQELEPDDEGEISPQPPRQL